MLFFKIVAVFTAIALTTANPIPEESVFSEPSDFSTNLFNSDGAADPLGDPTLLASFDEGLNTINSAPIDGADDGSSLFTQDFSVAADGLCSTNPNGPARKRDNTKCDFPTIKSPSITIPQLPNLLDLDFSGSHGSETEDDSYIIPLTDPIENLPDLDRVRTLIQLDPGECPEYPFVVSLCCQGPWKGAPLPGIRGAVYEEIKFCFWSE